MATEQYVNSAASTSAGTINNSSNPVTFSVSAGAGALFPAAGPFRVTVSNTDGTNAEVMLCTSIATDALTCARGSSATNESPVPSLLTHAAGSIVQQTLTVGAFNTCRAELCQIGTRANLPSTTGQRAGNRYKCTDSIYEYIFDGSVWQPFAGGYNVVEPVLANYTKIGTTATWISTYGGFTASMTAAGSSENNQAQVIAYPASPFYLDIAWIGQQFQNNGGVGLMVGSTLDATGKESLVAHGWQGSYSSIGHKYYTNSTTHSTDSGQYQWIPNGPLVWMRYHDDGVNRTWFTSPDGRTWRQAFQEALLTNFTEVSIGFIIVPFALSTDTHVVHWSVHS